MRTLHAGAQLLLPLALAAQQEPPVPAPAPAGPEIVLPGLRKLTVGGQYRLRYENQIDLDLDDDTRPDNSDFFSQRVRVALTLDFSDRLLAFVQLQDAREWGEEASTLDDSADGLDLHQAYAEVRLAGCPGGATRLGRQELSLGDQRLVGALDWRTQARSFDGVSQRWLDGDGGGVLAWAFQVRETVAPATVNDDQWFAGVQGTHRFGDPLLADLYVMVLHDDGAVPGTSASRFTLGTRWLAKLEAWEAGLELATQVGEQASADIPIGETWAGHVHVTHWLGGGAKPWVKLGVDAASGDDPDTADRERFNTLFPTVHAHWGMLDVALWENLFDPHLQLGAKPGERDEVTATWHFFRAMEGRDTFGGPNATLVPAGATDSRTIGNELDFVWTRQLDLGTTAKTTLQLGYGVFLPGAAPDSIGRDSLGHLAYAQFDLRF